MKSSVRRALGFSFAVGLTAQSHVVSADDTAVSDPAEGFNRKVFGFNQAIDRYVMTPIARGYVVVTPQLARTGVHNLVSNLGEPEVFVNDVLQLHPVRAAVALGRFGVNSTIGVVGLFDVARRWGLRSHHADFGQTFGRWGVGPGPHLELPILGPSDVRDALGAGVGAVSNPLSLASGGAASAARAGFGAVGAVDGRARLLPVTDRLRAESTDYYLAMRNAYGKRRAALVSQARGGGKIGRDEEAAPTARDAAMPTDGGARPEQSSTPRPLPPAGSGQTAPARPAPN
jgi:phospholipid-binding lipoprotein MlaA